MSGMPVPKTAFALHCHLAPEKPQASVECSLCHPHPGLCSLCSLQGLSSSCSHANDTGQQHAVCVAREKLTNWASATDIDPVLPKLQVFQDNRKLEFQ